MTAQSTDGDFQRARDLIFALLEGMLRAGETEELERLIRARSDIRRHYIRMMHLHAGLHQHSSILAPPSARLEDDVLATALNSNDAMVVSAIREEQPEPEVLLTAPASIRSRGPRAAPNAWWRRNGWWPIGSIAALLAVCLGVWLVRTNTLPHAATAPMEAQDPAPAAISASEGAAWAATSQAYKAGDKLAKGKPLELESGVVEIGLAGGGRIVCEAPVVFTVDSAQHVTLDSGKLVARMKGGGLVVQTPGLTITDLGTEFGVHVTSNGTTNLAVFEGSVRTSIVNSPTAPVVFGAGQGVTYSLGAAPVPMPAASLGVHFVRAMPPSSAPLDLVDIVEGGDGTAHHSGWGMDPSDGHYVASDDWPGPPRTAGRIHIFSSHLSLDCCFVTPADGRSTAVDSGGDSFTFPGSGTAAQGPIWAGGVVPPLADVRVDPTLGGVNFSAAGHGMLFMQANSGITFNLQAIRAAIRGAQRLEFHATIGKPRLIAADGADRPSVIRGYVLVDGASRFDKNCSSRDGTPFRVDLQIDATDRFLTLAATGASLGPEDGLLVGDPTLRAR